MLFVRRLVVVLVAVLLVPLLVGWYVVARFFLFTDAQRSTLALSVAASIVGTAAFTAFTVWRLATPIERALRAEGPDEAVRARAITAALRLPGRLAAVLMGLSSTLVVVVMILELRQGLAYDVAIAGAGSALAFGIMGAMLGYSVALDGVARVLARLGSTEVLQRGTSVRGKVLTVCYGLLAIATLLLLSVS